MDDTGAYAIMPVLTVYLIGLLLYLIPTFVAFSRRHPNRWIIMALNIGLGATGVAWLGCLVWALHAVHVSNDPAGSDGGESGLNVVANDVFRVRVEPPLSAQPPPLPWAGAQLPPLPTADPIERLERLKKLLDDKVLDRDQFDKMRNAILAGQ